MCHGVASDLIRLSTVSHSIPFHVADVLVLQCQEFVEGPHVAHQLRIRQKGDADHLDKRASRVGGESLYGPADAAHEEADLQLHQSDVEQSGKW